MNDTIVAISTALGIGAISIVRLSGEESINIVNKIFKGEDLSKAKSHTIKYGHIIENDVIIDEVLVSVFLAPKTFTAENVVEINCHGGIATTKKIFELAITNGARPAEPGEFTKRAFLNGRIDLIEAEGVMDLISAKTEEARSLAINQVDGKVSAYIKELRSIIVEILANIEVNIDYPEYEDIEVMNNDIIMPRIELIRSKLKSILKDSEQGKIIRDGIDTAIIGRPNVGKSSLLNRLIDEEKAIVTEVAGTTRDIVEGQLNLEGVLLNIIDTAGIRKTDDIVEKIGVSKSLELVNKAELILFLLNNNEEIKVEDLEILDKIKTKNHIIVINKIDLDSKINLEKLNGEDYVSISTVTNEGINELKTKIKDMFDVGSINTKDFNYITNARSIALVKQSIVSLDDVEEAIKNKVPTDMVEIDIKQIWNNLGEIIGETYQEELVEQIFSRFCLGK